MHKHNDQGVREPGRKFWRNGKFWRIIKVYCTCGTYVKNEVKEEPDG